MVIDISKPYKLLNQLLSISEINFRERVITGYVELAIIPLRPDVRQLILSCSQSLITRALVDNVEAVYSYNDTISQNSGDKRRGYDSFNESCYKRAELVNSDVGNGEITLTIPQDALSTVAKLKLVRVGLEFCLKDPAGAVQFIIPDDEKTDSWDDDGVHVFTCKYDRCSPAWLPCLNSNDVCPWRIEITAPAKMTVVASGTLMETVYSNDALSKVWHYQVVVPTAVTNIGFAVGAFELFVQSDMELTVSHFCLPPLLPLVKCSTLTMNKILEFFEELLSARYPFTSYKLVFVDQAPCDLMAYSTFCLLSVNVLFHKKIIDQVPLTRTLLAYGVAQQFFGCFLSSKCWADSWLNGGIAAYIAGLYVQKFFGNNEYVFQLQQTLQEVTQYERDWGGILLCPKADSNGKLPTQHHCETSLLFPQTCSPLYSEMLTKKAHLIFRMLEKKLGKEQLFQVFNKFISVAVNASGPSQKYCISSWTNLLMSTNSFVKCVSNVTGQDLQTFLNQWVYTSGFAKFDIRFTFNRKRNLLELEVEQEMDQQCSLLYHGPVTLVVQELDGAFSQVLQIDDALSKHDIQLHSKARRQKKKKIPLITGEEVDVDLSTLDPDSPVLWIRFDMEMLLYRIVVLHQPDYQWQYELKYEKDCMSQMQALERLPQFATSQTRTCLLDIVENERMFYRIRTIAAFALVEVENKMLGHGPLAVSSSPLLLTTFWKLFGAQSCENMVKPNDFSNLQHYYLMKAIPLALSKQRNIQGIPLPQVDDFLLSLLKYNINTQNKFSDDCYRAAVIEALSSTITANLSLSRFTFTGDRSCSELPVEMRRVIEEVALHLNHDKLLPSYKRVVAVACLRVIYQLQHYEYCSRDASFFFAYAAPGQFLDLRLAAVECLVKFLKGNQDSDVLFQLLDLIASDKDQQFSYESVKRLIQSPPFTAKDTGYSSVNSDVLVNRLWTLLSKLNFNFRLRSALADFYFLLFGKSRPSCLPPPELGIVLNLKDKTVLSGAAIRDAAVESIFSEDELIRRPSAIDLTLSNPGSSFGKSKDFDLHISDVSSDDDD